ncbi:hypothetical protein [Vampirovibrio chlorellavorus]|uniref:hypothetical protein n=1 Tax=Vampirovibrio chlorellavorus TaxID=758823 RepID=UPI0026E9FC57|nr:hypothetical protein [Vampirovibrio chlorellavorus]
MAVKFTFKTAFQIAKNIINVDHVKWLGTKTKEILHKTGDAMSNIGDHIHSFVQHGWNFAKDHIITGFQTLYESFGDLIHRGSELLFGSSSIKTASKSLKFGGQNDSPAQSSQAFNPPTMAGQAIEQKDFTKAQTLEIQLKAQAAQRKFEREAKKPNITESERSSISVRYATEIFNPLFENLELIR